MTLGEKSEGHFAINLTGQTDCRAKIVPVNLKLDGKPSDAH